MATKEEIAQNEQFLLLSPYFQLYSIIVLSFKDSFHFIFFVMFSKLSDANVLYVVKGLKHTDTTQIQHRYNTDTTQIQHRYNTDTTQIQQDNFSSDLYSLFDTLYEPSPREIQQCGLCVKYRPGSA